MARSKKLEKVKKVKPVVCCGDGIPEGTDKLIQAALAPKGEKGKKVRKVMLKVGKPGDECCLLNTLDAYPEVLKPKEVQEILRISRATFFRMVEDDRMAGAIRVGGSWRVVRDRLREWLIKETE